jgi:hypothetical protein
MSVKSHETPSGPGIDDEIVSRSSTSKKELLPSGADDNSDDSSSGSIVNNTVSGVEIKAILGRWEGPADNGTDGVFFQLHLAGHTKPGKEENWFYDSELSEISDMLKEFNRSLESKKRAKKPIGKKSRVVKVAPEARGGSRNRPTVDSGSSKDAVDDESWKSGPFPRTEPLCKPVSKSVKQRRASK